MKVSRGTCFLYFLAATQGTSLFDFVCIENTLKKGCDCFFFMKNNFGLPMKISNRSTLKYLMSEN